jgi:hypothetical protein
MVRAALWFGVLLLAAALASAAPARAEFTPPLVQKLKSQINFGGFEKDERLTLRDALDQLSEIYDLTFKVNEKAFKQEMVEEVLNVAVVATTPLPSAKGLSLERALQDLLARVPSDSGATYLIRDRYIEITTVQALSKEVRGHNNGPLLPLVNANIDRLLLSEALQLLAEQAGLNVVVDARAGEKAKAAVTARLRNVPLDTAVRLLANMAELKSVQIDNVLYVTTPDNAKALQEEQEKRAPKQPGDEKAGPPAPAETPK